MEAGMRKLIAGMKISVDGKIEGRDGSADWVQAWSEDYGLTSRIDACILGGGMYPGYEQYWTSIQNEPDKVVWNKGNHPTEAELKWAKFTKQAPHYVLSKTLTSANWPNTSFLRSVEDIISLKQQPGKDIYLVGGARTTASLIESGLVDELRLIVYPLLTGEGKALFTTIETRRELELLSAEQLEQGCVLLSYKLAVAAHQHL